MSHLEHPRIPSAIRHPWKSLRVVFSRDGRINPSQEPEVSQEPEIFSPEVFHPRNERQARLMRPLFEAMRSIAFLNPETNMYGGENLATARELLFQGKKLIITPNHLSHIDHVFLWAFIDQECQKMGLGDIFGQFVFIARDSLYDESHFRIILPLVDIIGVVSPRELEKLFKARDREKIKRARPINEAANEKFGECLESGRIGVVYVEGQRSPDGKLMEINPHVASLLRKGDYLMAASFCGTECVLPREWQDKFAKKFAAIVEMLTGEENKLKILSELPKLLGRLFKDLPHPFAPVTFTISEPYSVPQEVDDATLVRIVRSKIAELLPPEYQ